MTLTDITLPEVKVYTQSAKFFRRGEQDFVEISFIGAKDTLVERVSPRTWRISQRMGRLLRRPSDAASRGHCAHRSPRPR